MDRFRAALCCALLVAGCSSSGSDPTSSPAATSPATASGRFLALVETVKYQDVLMAYSSAELLSLARRECRDFADSSPGSRVSLMISDLQRSGWDTIAAAALIHAATTTLCR